MKMLKSLTAMICAAGLFVILSTNIARAADDNICTVNDSIADLNSSSGKDLALAVYLASHWETDNSECRGGMQLTVNNIKLVIPLEIAPKVGSEESPYVIQGVASDGGRIVINSNFVKSKYLKDNKGCALTIKGGKTVIIKDIELNGTPDGVELDGLCIGGDGSGSATVILDNVLISGFNAGAAIKVNENSDVIILPNVKISKVKQAIVSLNAGAMSGVALLPTTKAFDVVDVTGMHRFQPDVYLCLEEVLMKGFNGAGVVCGDLSNGNYTGISTVGSVPEEEAATTEEGDASASSGGSEYPEFNFSLEGIAGSGKLGTSFFDSSYPATVQIFKVRPGSSTTKFQVEGAVVEFDSHQAPEKADAEGKSAFCSATRVDYLRRLQVYGITEDNGRKATFISYVEPQTDKSAGMGIMNTNTNDGGFRFEIEKKYKSVILIPEFADFASPGTASIIIPIDKENDVQCPKNSVLGGGFDGGFYANDILNYTSVKACQQDTVGSQGVNNIEPEADTDGDGIFDWQEMVVTINDLKTNIDGKTYDEIAAALKTANTKIHCDCTPEMVSCWNLKDSDYDGVPDNKELKNEDGTVRNSNNDEKFDETEYKPDTRSPDSDGDMIPDGVEDRKMAFNALADAYYYVDSDDNALSQSSLYSDAKNDKIKCNLGAYKLIGVTYGLYIVDGTGETNPKPLNLSNLKSNSDIMRLQCRNETSFYPTNFNGVYDFLEDRSDLRTPNDITATMNQCQPGTTVGIAMMNDPDGQWVNSDGFIMDGGIPKLFKQVTADGTPDWELVNNTCPSQDGDLIPDCLEMWTVQCPATGAMTSKVLNPNAYDSDCDGIQDDQDVCPFTNKNLAQGNSVLLCNQLINDYITSKPADKTIEQWLDDKKKLDKETDKYVSTKALSEYSCDPKRVYADYAAPILAYFLDRDGDGRKDGLEDMNLDGNLANAVDNTEAGYMKNETDPLRFDTDGDGLNDYEELNNSHTNPVDSNSDDDGLDDNKEVSQSGTGDLLKFEDSDKAQEGCLNLPLGPNGAAMGSATLLDTDPWETDTDKDGLSDGVEVAIGTNPNSFDSDGDTLSDGVETKGNKNGNWPWYDEATKALIPPTSGSYDFSQSNPCATDTDKDGTSDDAEVAGGASPSLSGVGCLIGDGSGTWGIDTDCDGLPDNFETAIGSNPKDKDTDNDGLIDGCTKDSDVQGEMCYHVINQLWSDTTINTAEGESKPGLVVLNEETGQLEFDKSCPNQGKDKANIKESGILDGLTNGGSSFCGIQIGIDCGSDSDGDGLPDYYEKMMFKTFANNPDSDGDGIVDGIETKWVIANETAVGSGLFTLMTQKGPEQYVALSMTNPLDQDTDKDTLADGFVSATNFEDFNCNGRVDTDINGSPIELDPRTGNSDGDSWDDKDEFCWDGVCGSGGNMSRATSAQREGCGNIGGAGGETWGMTLMFVVMLAATRVAGVVLKRTKKAKARR